ncbi:MAG: CBS domain-containing protein [Chloroflexota bacterium]
MFVRDHMTRDPRTINPKTTYPEAINLMREHKIRRLPVLEKDRLVGIVVEKDLLSNQPSPASSLSIHEMYALLERLQVRQFMSSPVITITGDFPMEDAARIMVERKISCLPVMDGGTLVGMITETDIFKTFVDALGGGESGTRITIHLPDQVGALAEITRRIAAAQGNIIALTASKAQIDLHQEITIKESGADSDTLIKQLEGSDAVIIDLRTNANYEPIMFGN